MFSSCRAEDDVVVLELGAPVELLLGALAVDGLPYGNPPLPGVVASGRYATPERTWLLLLISSHC